MIHILCITTEFGDTFQVTHENGRIIRISTPNVSVGVFYIPTSFIGKSAREIVSSIKKMKLRGKYSFSGSNLLEEYSFRRRANLPA
jgi:hypothetical protein